MWPPSFLDLQLFVVIIIITVVIVMIILIIIIVKLLFWGLLPDFKQWSLIIDHNIAQW